jgi:Cu+-exporting ATPase
MENTTDPVCGMEVSANESAGQTEYGGETYYFCSTNCKERFDNDPQQYVTDSANRA